VTLILSHLSRGFVLQVSDRLVTRIRPGDSPSPFDALANKTIIYGARDAIVSMSYTGPAYVGKLSTDDWIAQTLTGVDVSEKFGMRTGTLPHWWDIGQATRLLLRELSHSEISTQNSNFELVVSGWQWKNVKRSMEGRYQPVPMAWALSKTEGSKFEKEVERLPRHWYWKNRCYFYAAPRSNLSKGERDKLFDRLNEEAAQSPAPKTNEEVADRVEKATVDTVRAASVSSPYVGPNCMSVVIAPPHQIALIRVTFFPYEHHTAQLVAKTNAPITFPAAFSPWIIGQGLMHKPSVHIGKGGFDLQIGPFTVKLSGPDGPDKGLLFAMSSQQRPARPTK
jgi:hypothetical protein